MYTFYIKPLTWYNDLRSIAMINHTCPKCDAPKEHYCVTSSGKRRSEPHVERYTVLTLEERTTASQK